MGAQMLEQAATKTNDVAGDGTTTATLPPRQPANRADHADDEHLVFWDSDTAQSAVTRPSRNLAARAAEPRSNIPPLD